MSITFNTGRLYQPVGHKFAGQVIKAEIVGSFVYFSDLSRGIDGYFKLNNPSLVWEENLQAVVMAHYDVNDYLPGRPAHRTIEAEIDLVGIRTEATMTNQTRTFGDLLVNQRPHRNAARTCQFCRKWGNKVENGELWKYSVRHYICRPCIGARLLVVLPSIVRHEGLQKRLAAISTPPAISGAAFEGDK